MQDSAESIFASAIASQASGQTEHIVSLDHAMIPPCYLDQLLKKAPDPYQRSPKDGPQLSDTYVPGWGRCVDLALTPNQSAPVLSEARLYIAKPHPKKSSALFIFAHWRKVEKGRCFWRIHSEKLILEAPDRERDPWSVTSEAIPNSGCAGWTPQLLVRRGRVTYLPWVLWIVVFMSEMPHSQEHCCWCLFWAFWT